MKCNESTQKFESSHTVTKGQKKETAKIVPCFGR